MGNFAQPQQTQAPAVNPFMQALFNAQQSGIPGGDPLAGIQTDNSQYTPSAQNPNLNGPQQAQYANDVLGGLRSYIDNWYAQSPTYAGARGSPFDADLTMQYMMQQGLMPNGMVGGGAQNPQVMAMLQQMRNGIAPAPAGSMVPNGSSFGAAPTGSMVPNGEPFGAAPNGSMVPNGMPNPKQNGMMQRQPGATMNGMPNPQNRVLGGSAGMNPWMPKKNPFGV
jgi:hypothetical protein